jgi:hypothetical protein
MPEAGGLGEEAEEGGFLMEWRVLREEAHAAEYRVTE